MATFGEGLASAVRTGFCQGLPGVVTGALLFTALTAETGVGAVAGLATAAGAAAIYGVGCNRPLPDDAFPSPPFDGGQCDTAYDVSGNAAYNGTAIPAGIALGPVQVNGPIRGITSVNGAGNVTQVYVLGKVDTGHPDGRYGIATLNTDFGGGNTFKSASITGIVRRDGLPDNCGSLPPSPPPAITAPDATITPNVTYVNNEGDTVTVPIVLAFGYAQVDVNGELNIPVSIQVDLNPVVNFNGQFNLRTGDLNINLGDPGAPAGRDGPCSGEPAPNPDIPDPTLPLPPSDPIPPSPTVRPERRKILRGCQVITTVINGRQTEIDQTNNPDIYAPALGYVNFLVQVGNKTAWTTDIAVKNTNQIIECPWVAGAIDVRGTPSFLNQFTVYPLYTQQTFPPQYPPES